MSLIINFNFYKKLLRNFIKKIFINKERNVNHIPIFKLKNVLSFNKFLWKLIINNNFINIFIVLFSNKKN